MATITDRDSFDGASVTTLASGSFTPAANVGLVCFGRTTSDTDFTSITGHGTWAKAVHFTSGSERAHIWYLADTGGSPSASAITVTFSTTIAAAGVSFAEIEGFNLTDPIGVTGDEGSVYNSGGTPYAHTITLASFASASNYTAICMSGDNGEGLDASGDGYTELTNSNDGTITQAIGYKASEDNSAVWNSTALDYVYTRSFGCELILAAAGGGRAKALTLLGVS